MGNETSRTRRSALRTIGSVVAVGLAGCSSSDPADTTQPSTTTAMSTTTATATETTTATTTEERTATTTETTTTGSTDSPQFVRNPEEVHATLVEEAVVPEDEVLLGFRLEDSSLPFTTEVYHAPEGAEIQATETYDTQDLGEVGLVPDPPWPLSTVDTDREDVHYGTTAVGEPLTVTLVARHDGETFRWSAWDRTGYPYAGEDATNPALEVDCYCGGAIYTAPGGGTWARVIQVTPTERVDPGTAIALNWTSSRA